MEKQVIIEAFDALRRAFAMMALAIVSNMPREKLFQMEEVKVEISGKRQKVLQESTKLKLPDNFRAMRLPDRIASGLRDRVARGDVTTIQPNPEPFTWLIVKSAHEEFRTVYGVWVGRAASWRGKIDPAKLPRLDNMLTPEEAVAKGIPLPSFKE